MLLPPLICNWAEYHGQIRCWVVIRDAATFKYTLKLFKYAINMGESECFGDQPTKFGIWIFLHSEQHTKLTNTIWIRKP
jgi:hypothetical protein